MIQVDLTHMRRFIALPYEAALAPRLRIAHNHLQKNDGAGGDFTGWVRLPQEYDRQEFDRIQAAARRIQSDSRALVVIGIGGSYLGARGVIECLCSPNYNLRRKDTPNIYFVGNGLSDRQLRETMELLEGVDFSVNVISKSGTTTEPAVAFRFFRELLEKKYGPDGAARRIYATTDRQKGALKSLADQAGSETFVVPDDIGGRYSVLTAVGLLPIAVAGIDIRALMQGAARMQEVCTAGDMEQNPAWQYAGARYQLYRAGKKIEIRPSGSCPSGGSSCTASPRARRTRACSRPAWSSRRTCTPWASISSRGSAICWRRWCASTRRSRRARCPLTPPMATG